MQYPHVRISITGNTYYALFDVRKELRGQRRAAGFGTVRRAMGEYGIYFLVRDNNHIE